MAKRNNLKMILTGLVWTGILGCLVRVVFQSVFQFDLMNVRQWQELWFSFRYYQAQINMWFILSLVLIPFVWGIGWCFLYRWHWSQILHLKRKKYRSVSPEKAIPVKNFTPQKITVQSGAVYGVNIAATEESMSETTLSESKTLSSFSDEDDVISLSQALAHYPVELFPHILLEGAYATLAISTDEKALVIKTLGGEVEQWSMDVSQDWEHADWFNEKSVESAPAANIKRLAEELSKSEAEAEIIPAVVVMSGELLNAAAAEAYLNDNGVRLLRFGAGGPETLTDLMQVMDELFSSASSPKDPEKESEEERAFS